MKPKMSSGRWLIMFFGCLVLLLVLVMAFNALVDPYGAFGDPLLHWWSYDETMNPRLAKVSYLEKHENEYDSFIVGSSGSSSFPVEELNTYLDASFYNCFFYGTDMASFEQMSDYLLDNYNVKNLLLNLSPKIAVSYGDDNQPDLSERQHYHVDGTGPMAFYLRYMLINPMDSIEKLRYRLKDGYLQQPYRCFDSDTGAYDKSYRDAEAIGTLEDYLAVERYGVFNDYPSRTYRLKAMDEALESVGRIVQRCREKGVHLIVTCQPSYAQAMDFYDPDELTAFRSALADVTEYWDFTYSSVSFEPRYFYDETHFRNDVGKMALARIFGDDSVYVPADFGLLVTEGSDPGPYTAEPAAAENYTVRIPILMYHHLVETGSGETDQLTDVQFREQMELLKAEGYEAVSFGQLRAYVTAGASLPEKPFVITFDDGYESNYDLAYPVLRDCGFPAAIYLIGVSVGRDTYKDTGVAMTPHFSLAQAQEMEASGLITIGSHGYDLHEVEGRDPDPIREGVLQRADETEKEYAAYLETDASSMEELLGRTPEIFAYPYNLTSDVCEVVLRESGVWCTVAGDRSNELVRGLSQSLRQMGRHSVLPSMTAQDVLQMVVENG